MVSKSGKVRAEEKERDRGESSRLLVSEANVSTLLFLDGIIGERILVLGRLTEDRSSSVQRLLHSRSRSVSYRDDSPSRHPEVLLFRIWAWVSAKDGSISGTSHEGRFSTAISVFLQAGLTSAQRVHRF
ncbi:hypothetical protein V512_005665 [Mesotoga sp. Brook.08.105.5.1]|nr:hypothetical protein V512_005665 [Mesotoga sp. Brook.08.105.5.1]